MLEEGNPSLKNLNTNPGATVWALASGLLAEDNLTNPLSAPLKIPVY